MKWFGVKASSTSGFEGFGVIDLELVIRTASVNTVFRISSLTESFPSMAYRLRFTERTSLSHTPDMWDAPGG